MTARLASLFIVVLLLSACKSTGPTSPPQQIIDAPTYQSIINQHNERIKKFRGINAGGVIEMRWTDDGGKHFETGQAEVWIKLPDQTAMNIQKMGERLMWLGSKGNDVWVLSFSKEEKVLYIYDSKELNDEDSPTHLPIEPGLMLKLLGLSRLEMSDNSQSQTVAFDEKLDSWVLRVKDDQQSLRFYFDRKKLLPVRIETLSEDGQVQMHSNLMLRRYNTVEMVGLIPGTQPQFPTLVDIYTKDGSGAIKLALRDPVDDVNDKFFDLNWIIRTFKPTRIQRDAQESPTP